MERFGPEFIPPPRLLMGAGPCNVHPRVLQAMNASLLGHMDPDFIRALDDVCAMLRAVFQTENASTWPISATGTGGMEAAIVNTLEPGDTVVVGDNGYFASRLGTIASRAGATVISVKHEAGLPVDPDRMAAEVARQESVKVVAVVHAETSTGVVSPVADMAKVAHDAGALLLVDAVTSLGGVELRIDDWGVDICYSGTQKCLSCPPGLAPITFSDRAMAALEARQTPVQSFYFDMTQLRSYFQLRSYHHTAPINQIYALREGLRIVLEEGVEARWARHMAVGRAFQAGIEAMGLDLFVKHPDDRLPNLSSVLVPGSVNGANARAFLMERHNLEVSPGLGETTSSMWRVGLMGYNATPSNVFTSLAALEDALLDQSFEVPIGASLAAAQRSFENVV